MDLYTLLGIFLSFLISGTAIGLIVSKKMAAVSKEIGELFTVIFTAFADGQLTGDEIKKIIDEADDIVPAFKKALRGK